MPGGHGWIDKPAAGARREGYPLKLILQWIASAKARMPAHNGSGLVSAQVQCRRATKPKTQGP